jgi:hypothetical protein
LRRNLHVVQQIYLPYLTKPVWNEVTRGNLWDGMIERETELGVATRMQLPGVKIRSASMAQSLYFHYSLSTLQLEYHRVSETSVDSVSPIKSDTCTLQLHHSHAPICVHVRGGRPLSVFARYSKRNGACQPKVPATRTNRERDRAIRLSPSLTDNIPDRQVIPRKRDRCLRRLAWLELNVCETFQDRGRLLRRCRVMQVELGDLRRVVRKPVRASDLRKLMI